MKCFINCYLIAHLCKIARCRKTARTCADYSNLMTVLYWHFRCVLAVFTVPVSDKTFKSADTYRFTLNASYAFAFTLLFLGTYTSAYCRKRA